jgi:hypothetical protein
MYSCVLFSAYFINFSHHPALKSFLFGPGHELSDNAANGFRCPYVGAGIAWSVLQSVYATGNSSSVTTTKLADMVADICHVLLASVQRLGAQNTEYGIFSKQLNRSDI